MAGILDALNRAAQEALQESGPTAEPIGANITSPPQAAGQASTLQDTLMRAAQESVQENAPVVEGPNFLERVGERLGERGEAFKDIVEEPLRGDKAFDIPGQVVEKGFQVLGKVVAGGVADVAGEVMASGFNFLSNVASAVTPDFIEDPLVKGVGDAFEGIVGTDIAQAGLEAAGKGIEAYQAWAEENPRAALNLDSLVNIAAIAAPVKVSPKPAAGILGRAGQRVEATAATQIAKAEDDFLFDLVSPKITEAVGRQRERRTEGGGFFTSVETKPSLPEQSMMDAVRDVVSPDNTVRQNLASVQTASFEQGALLRNQLEALPNKIGRQEIKGEIDGIVARLADEGTIAGDLVSAGSGAISEVRKILASNPNTPAGILKSRIEIDAWARRRQPKVLDPTAPLTASRIAMREIRTTLNDMVARNAPGIDVAGSLSRQSNMIKALDSIDIKALNEARTGIGQLLQRVTQAVGIKDGLKSRLTAVGLLSAVGAGGAFAPAITAPVVGAALAIGAGLGLRQVIRSPKSKLALRSLLKGADEAINLATRQGDLDLVRQLRLDRATVIEILKSGQEPRSTGEQE